MGLPRIGEGVRQGDVVLVRMPKGSIPKEARAMERDNGRVVLEYGEVTGHSHALADPDVEYLETGTGNAVEHWLRYGSTATLPIVHEEHGAIELEPGSELQQWWPFGYESPEELRRDLD